MALQTGSNGGKVSAIADRFPIELSTAVSEAHRETQRNTAEHSETQRDTAEHSRMQPETAGPSGRRRTQRKRAEWLWDKKAEGLSDVWAFVAEVAGTLLRNSLRNSPRKLGRVSRENRGEGAGISSVTGTRISVQSRKRNFLINAQS